MTDAARIARLEQLARQVFPESRWGRIEVVTNGGVDVVDSAGGLLIGMTAHPHAAEAIELALLLMLARTQLDQAYRVSAELAVMAERVERGGGGGAMKKRWRDEAKGKERLSVAIGVVEREPGAFYGTVPLGWLRSLSEEPEAFEGLLTDLQAGKVPGLRIERSAQGEPLAVVGPTVARIDAEAFANSLVQMICDTLGVSRSGGPEVRAAGEGLFADFNTSAATNPRQLGGPPDDIPARLARAAHLASGEDDALTLMLAAWHKMRGGKEPHPLEFITLARAVVAWAPVAEVAQTELGVLEARGRHLAHLIAENISPADQFVLLLCNTGANGQMTHIGSMDRATIVELVGEFVEHLRTDAARLQ